MERIAAGGIVFFTLIILADVPLTSSLAVAFAYIILLSALMAVGPVAFARLSSITGSGDAGGTPRNVGGGSGGYHAKP